MSGGNDQGTWGVIPETTYDLSNTVSLWLGKHTIKAGASITYDVTEQLFQPLQNGVYTLQRQPDAVSRLRSSSTQSFALVPEARLMYPEGHTSSAGSSRKTGARCDNLTLNLGLRYDVEFIKDIPDWPAGTDGNNFDPRVGFAWDPRRRPEVGGPRRLRPLHPAAPDLHHRQGRRGGRNGQVLLSLDADRRAVPDLPQRAPGVPAGSGAPGARTSRRSRPTSRTSSPGPGTSPSSARSARAPASRSPPTSTAARSTASST